MNEKIELALQEFYEAKNETENFKSEHKEIISTLKALEEKMNEKESLLREVVKNEKESYEDEAIAITFSQPYRKWIDYDTAKENLSPAERILLDEMTTREVDRDKFIKLCKDGVFPDKARLAAYKEEPLSPKVILKLKTIV